MRLHTLIFAARMSVPPVGMVYDPKVAYYLETLSMPSLGRVEDFSLETALDVIRHVAEDRQRYSEILREKAARLAREAHRDEEYLTQLLCDGYRALCSFEVLSKEKYTEDRKALFKCFEQGSALSDFLF
jgi:polysaccharide pyruvyl transferase WcaK-like protein